MSAYYQGMKSLLASEILEMHARTGELIRLFYEKGDLEQVTLKLGGLRDLADSAASVAKDLNLASSVRGQEDQ